MNRVTLVNTCALVAAVGLTIQLGGGHRRGPSASSGNARLVDASFHPVPLRR